MAATTLRIKADATSITFRTPGRGSGTTPMPSAGQTYRRPRGNSISKRLRSASDLEEKGVINRNQKSVLKDMLIGGDHEVLAALNAYEEGDDKKLGVLLESGALNRRPSLDLFDGLDLDDLNVGLGTPAGANLAFMDEDGAGGQAANTAAMRPSISGNDGMLDALDFLGGSNPPSRKNSLAMAQQRGMSIELPFPEAIDNMPGGFFSPAAFDDFLDHDGGLLGMGSLDNAVNTRIRLRSGSRGSMDFGSPRTVRQRRGSVTHGAPRLKTGAGRLFRPAEPKGDDVRLVAVQPKAPQKKSKPKAKATPKPRQYLKVVTTPGRKGLGTMPQSAPGALQLGPGVARLVTVGSVPRPGATAAGAAKKGRAVHVMANINGTPQLVRALTAPPPGAKIVRMTSWPAGAKATPKGNGAVVIRTTPKKSVAATKGSTMPSAKIKVGAYSPEARRRRIEKFHDKRKRRMAPKKVKKDVRTNTHKFLKKEDEDLLKDIIAEEFDMDAFDMDGIDGDFLL